MRDRMNSKRCTGYLKALADPQRLLIVQCLQSGPKSVGELAEMLGIAIPNISHHLKVLRGAYLAVATRKGRFIFYALSPGIQPQTSSARLSVLDLGCCRLEFDGPRQAARTGDPQRS